MLELLAVNCCLPAVELAQYTTKLVTVTSSSVKALSPVCDALIMTRYVINYHLCSRGVSVMCTVYAYHGD